MVNQDSARRKTTVQSEQGNGVDFVTPRDLTQLRMAPKVGHVPNLAFDFVTRRDLPGEYP